MTEPTGHDPAPTTRPAGGPPVRVLPSKWILLGAYWIVQSVLVYLGWAIWIHTSQSAAPTSPFGTVPTPREFVDVLTDAPVLLISGIYALAVAILQGVLLLPVRKPVAVRERGASLWASIGVAGLAIAAVWIGAIITVGSAIAFARNGDPDWFVDWIDETGVRPWMTLVPLLITWAFATPLLIAFCRRGPRESVLARLSTRILQGTAIEVVAIIPLDVMIRRKTDCYCNSGTFWSLMLCGTVGVVMGGPAVVYTVLSRRRRRWYDGRCESCGYDMSGLRSADRCPECGSGWTPTTPAPSPGPAASGVHHE